MTFTGVSNITGGSAADTFTFANGASVSGKLDGGVGTDTLKYSYTTPVTVNLASQYRHRRRQHRQLRKLRRRLQHVRHADRSQHGQHLDGHHRQLRQGQRLHCSPASKT